jgi:hypothetical protein
MDWKNMQAIAAELAVDVGDGLLRDLGDVGVVPHLSEEVTRTGGFIH